MLCEFLILTGESANDYLNKLQNSQHYALRPFDTLAAAELAAMYLHETSLSSARRNDIKNVDTKTRLKFDRQIVAIAKAHGASEILSDDGGVKTFGELHGIKVTQTWELPLPELPAQATLF